MQYLNMAYKETLKGIQILPDDTDLGWLVFGLSPYASDYYFANAIFKRDWVLR